jgi:SP family myo-inositol transporter-like MFS transporter 13
MPESPGYLYKMRKYEKGQAALFRIYKTQSAKEMDHQLTLEADNLSKEYSIPYTKQVLQLLTDYRGCLFVGCALQMFQQFSGINTIYYYGPSLVQKAGMSEYKGEDIEEQAI